MRLISSHKQSIRYFAGIFCAAWICSGCSHSDPTETAAPPPPPGAVAPPPVAHNFPHHKLPPLVAPPKS